jgi:putative flippase GtrA
MGLLPKGWKCDDATCAPQQMFRYAACGGLNMVMDAVLYYLALHYLFAERDVELGVFVLSPAMASLAVVFPITFFNGFWLNRNVAFGGSPLRTGSQLWRYALSVTGSIVLTAAFMKLLIDVCGLWPTPSKIFTTILVAAYSFLMQKYFTFRQVATQTE